MDLRGMLDLSLADSSVCLQEATNPSVLVVDNLSGALVFLLFSFLVLAHSSQSFIPGKFRLTQLT